MHRLGVSRRSFVVLALGLAACSTPQSAEKSGSPPQPPAGFKGTITALCSPTRSTILPGRNHHLNGMAAVAEAANAADNGASGEGSPNGSVNENQFFNGHPDSAEENGTRRPAPSRAPSPGSDFG